MTQVIVRFMYEEKTDLYLYFEYHEEASAIIFGKRIAWGLLSEDAWRKNGSPVKVKISIGTGYEIRVFRRMDGEITIEEIELNDSETITEKDLIDE